MNENRLVDSRESNVYDRIIKSKPNAAETCDFNRKKVLYVTLILIIIE